MKHLSRSILLLICLTVLFQVGYACTCESVSIEDEINTTEFIFVGEVTKITEDKSYVPPKIEKMPPLLQKIIDGRKRFIITFKVKKNFKGVKDKEFTLIQYQQDSPCEGIYFDEGNSFLIYAHETKDNEVRSGGLCSRTSNFDKKSEEVRELTKFIKKKKP